MAVAILGDLSFTKMVSVPMFQNLLNMDYVPYQVSSLMTFEQYHRLLPSGVRYILVGCLAPLLVEVKFTTMEGRELELSMWM